MMANCNILVTNIIQLSPHPLLLLLPIILSIPQEKLEELNFTIAAVEREQETISISNF